MVDIAEVAKSPFRCSSKRAKRGFCMHVLGTNKMCPNRAKLKIQFKNAPAPIYLCQACADQCTRVVQ